MHYKIVEDEKIAGLADKVNSNIKAGFIPIGGISSRIYNDDSGCGYVHCQAMVIETKGSND